MKQHPIYTHLFITEDGKVYSTKSNKFLALCKHKSGYMIFSTRLEGRDSPAICFKVHRLVAETYLDNPNNLPQVNHIDGNKANNHVTNLEWVSVSDNAKHAYRVGLIPLPVGYNNPACKADVVKVEQAKALYSSGKSLRAIGREFGVTHMAVSRWLLL